MGFCGTAGAALYEGAFQTNDGAFVGDGVVGNPAGGPGSLSGFDIFSNGTTAFFNVTNGGVQINPVATSGQIAVGDVVQSVYQGIVSVFNPGLATPNLDPNGVTLGDPDGIPGTYQLVVTATFNEIVQSIGPLTATLLTDGTGTIKFFYDHPVSANINTGAGYGGIQVASANVLAGGITNFSITNPNVAGSGNTHIEGAITSVAMGAPANVVGFFNSLPTGIVTDTTVQFGCPDCAGSQASMVAGVAVNPLLTAKADANSSLTVNVPEPGTISLIGLGIAALGFGTARRNRRISW
jgi:hypothetical protein